MPHDPVRLPRVDRLVAHARLQGLTQSVGRPAVTEAVRACLAELRAHSTQGRLSAAPSEDEVAERVAASLDAFVALRVRRVINATGILVHTNLGRAPLSRAAAARVAETMEGSCSLELELATGRRGGRGAFVEAALARLTGAEAALVVNNCAAAILLLLASVARGRGVVVSRGELVEIGGGFRVPEIMAESGARLVEVGTTNKTRLSDYERALDADPSIGAILRVHTGNFQQIGFVERPELGALAELAKRRGVPLLEDLGGGALVELAEAGLAGEPTAQASVAAGVSALTFSTDKALGGPQGGVVLGERAWVDRARRHPLARALRLGRLPLAALEATLEHYLVGSAWSDVPALAGARRSAGDVEARAQAWCAALRTDGYAVDVVATRAEMGGGTLAGRSIPSFGMRILSDPERVAARLRAGRPAVVGRILDDRLVLDARSVGVDEDAALVEAVRTALAG
jgi:L-seryl-tRNA(Ser) seleniumtransferase